MGDQISLHVYYTDYIHKRLWAKGCMDTPYNIKNCHFKPRWKFSRMCSFIKYNKRDICTHVHVYICQKVDRLVYLTKIINHKLCEGLFHGSLGNYEMFTDKYHFPCNFLDSEF